MTGDPATSLESRLYRAALRLCPGEFHRDHGEEMVCDFDEDRGVAAVAGSRAMWTLRLLIVLDLVRTIAVQWLRTGLPAIGAVALFCSLSLLAGFASVARRISARMPVDIVDAEMVGLVLLTAVAVLVIVATVVFNLWVHRWVHRPRRPARR